MYNGIINIRKESGHTSHDVVARLRGILQQKKIGHTGTLDPDAVGVLPVCLGKATKLVPFLADVDKTYETVLLLGRETDTQDRSGKTVAERSVTCTEEELYRVLHAFLGKQEQIPPMYSAKKQDGKRLYQLAREGKTVERKPQQIEIFQLDPIEVRLPRVSLRITCSKGTYIRTLCHDIGQELGCGGCMESLVRTRVGFFSLEEALSLAEIEEACEKDVIREKIYSIDAFFSDLPAVVVETENEQLAYHGNVLPSDAPAADRIRLYDCKKHFLGVYSWQPERAVLRPELFCYDPEEGKENA